MACGVCTVKRLDTGEQEEVPMKKLSQNLERILHAKSKSS